MRTKKIGETRNGKYKKQYYIKIFYRIIINYHTYYINTNEVIKQFDIIGFELTRILLILSVIVVPLISLYIVTTICYKNNPNIKSSYLLTKIFIISLICTIFATIYLGYTLDMFGNIEDGMLVVFKENAETITAKTMESLEEYHISYLVINNVKSIIKALIISTIYVGFLILVLVRYWINRYIQIEKEERTKQVKELLIVAAIILIIEALINVGANIKEGNIQIPISIELEFKITDTQKDKIENKVKEIEEVIKYEYESADDLFDKLKESFGEKSYILENYDSSIMREKYIITIHYKDKETVKKQLEEMDGINKILTGL